MGNGSSLCSYLQEVKTCPSREHGRLFAYRQDLHTGTASHRLASNHCSGIWKVRNPAREDINPSLTHQLWLADLPHPELKPQQSRTETSLTRRRQRDHAAGVCMGSHALKIHCLFSSHRSDRAKMLHLQAGKTSCLAAQPVNMTGSRSSSSVFSKLGACFSVGEGCRVVVSYLHAVPRANQLT